MVHYHYLRIRRNSDSSASPFGRFLLPLQQDALQQKPRDEVPFPLLPLPQTADQPFATLVAHLARPVEGVHEGQVLECGTGANGTICDKLLDGFLEAAIVELQSTHSFEVMADQLFIVLAVAVGELRNILFNIVRVLLVPSACHLQLLFVAHQFATTVRTYKVAFAEFWGFALDGRKVFGMGCSFAKMVIGGQVVAFFLLHSKADMTKPVVVFSRGVASLGVECVIVLFGVEVEERALFEFVQKMLLLGLGGEEAGLLEDGLDAEIYQVHTFLLFRDHYINYAVTELYQPLSENCTPKMKMHIIAKSADVCRIKTTRRKANVLVDGIKNMGSECDSIHLSTGKTISS